MEKVRKLSLNVPPVTWNLPQAVTVFAYETSQQTQHWCFSQILLSKWVEKVRKLSLNVPPITWNLPHAVTVLHMKLHNKHKTGTEYTQIMLQCHLLLSPHKGLQGMAYCCLPTNLFVDEQCYNAMTNSIALKTFICDQQSGHKSHESWTLHLLT